MRRVVSSPECTCDGTAPWCPPCLVGAAIQMWLEHLNTLSVPMLKRRIPKLRGREAALLLEFTKHLPTRRNGKGYVE